MHHAFDTLLVLFSAIIIDTSWSNIITCDDNNNCSHQTIACAQNEECSITCKGITNPSCNSTTFICPHGPHNCSIKCGDWEGGVHYECEAAQINASLVSGGNLELSGNKMWAFHEAHVIAPIVGNSSITCWAAHCLRESTIDASNTISGDLIILNGGTAWNAKGMTVYCPPHGTCTVNAGVDVYGACNRCVIIAQPTTTLLNITASGTRALESTQITCPQRTDANVNCIINISPQYNYHQIVNKLTIYSVQSFTNLELNCDYYGHVNISTPPTIFCTNDYSATCTLSEKSSNVWECVEKSSLCQDWVSVSPSNNPTVSPITTSTAPSNHPSVFPTRLPSTMPSFAPSNHPTAFPSTMPSFVPSNRFTAFPSVMPSFVPSNNLGFPSTIPSANAITWSPILSSSRGTEQSSSRSNEQTKEIHASSTSSTAINSDSSLIILSIAIVLVLLCVCGIYYLNRKNNMTESHAIEVCVGVDHVQSNTQGQSEMDHRYNPDQVQRNNGGQGLAQVIQMNRPKIKYVLDNEKVTAGENQEGLDVRMGPDEFEVVGDDERDDDDTNATKGYYKPSDLARSNARSTKCI